MTEHYYMHGIKELPLSLQNTLTHPCFLGSTLAVKMEEYRIREFRKSIKKKKKEHRISWLYSCPILIANYDNLVSPENSLI